MTVININGSGGEFPPQKASMMLGSLILTTETGDQKVYTTNNSIKSFTIVSEHKGNVIFDITLSDGSRFRGDSDQETAHALLKLVDETASAQPKIISKDQVTKSNFQVAIALAGIVIILFVLFQCSGSSVPSSTVQPTKTANVVEDAYKLCSAIEATGMTTGCEVKGWNGTVDVRMDMTTPEAQKTCTVMAEMLSQKTRSFQNDRWKLQIFSPYSSDHPIAVCKLH